MPHSRPTYSDIEEIALDRNYGTDEDLSAGTQVTAKEVASTHAASPLEELLAHHLEAAQKVLATNHAKALAAVAVYEEKMNKDLVRTGQEIEKPGGHNGNSGTVARRIRFVPDNEDKLSTQIAEGSEQQEVMNIGHSGWLSPSRGRLDNSNYAKWAQEANPPGSVAIVGSLYGNGDLDSLASNSRGFAGKKGQKKGTPFELASVPVPLEILAGRQPPVMPAQPNMPAQLEDIQEVKASGTKLRFMGQAGQLDSSRTSEAKARGQQSVKRANTLDSDFGEVSMFGHMFQRENSEKNLQKSRASSRQTAVKKSQAMPSRLGEDESAVDTPMHKGSFWGSASARETISQDLVANKAAGNVFVDAEQMKEKVRAAIGKPEYNVQQFYSKTGCCQKIARQAWFDNLTHVVIGLNALWIGYDTDYNKAVTPTDAATQFQIAEHSFCAYFFVEWVIRFGAFEKKMTAFQDSWFIFDTVLMLMMVTETWALYTVFKILEGTGDEAFSADRLGDASILKLLRLLRLTRMARMVRLLRAMPELMILIKGMFVAMRSVFFTLCLLMVIIYIFSIAFTQLTEDSSIGEEYFSNIFDSMNTLLLYGTLLEDCPDVINAIGAAKYGIWLRFLFLFFILLASLTVMNMLVGVLVEVVSVVSSVEKEQLQVNFVKTRLFQMTEKLDSNADGQISKHEFEQLLQNPEAGRALRDVGVDVVGLIDYHDYLFQEEDTELSFANFMEIVLSLRGTNQSTVKDIVDLRKFLTAELGRMGMAIQEQFLMTRASHKASIHPRHAVLTDIRASEF